MSIRNFLLASGLGLGLVFVPGGPSAAQQADDAPAGAEEPAAEAGADPGEDETPEPAVEAPAADDAAPAADADEAGTGDEPGTGDEVGTGDEAAPGLPGDVPDDAPPVLEGAAPGELLGPGEGEPEVFEIVRDTFGDWEVRCAPDETECFMYQLARDEEENPVVEVSIVRLPAGNEAVAGVTAVSPLGTLLPAGIVLQVDSGEGRGYEFTFCSQVGCFARFGLTDELVNSMKRGRVSRLLVTSVGSPEQPIQLELSLAGFTAAYDSLTVPE